MESLRLLIQVDAVPYYKEAAERMLNRSAILVGEPELEDSPNTYIILTAPSYMEIAAVCHLAGYIERDKWNKHDT